MNDSYDYPELSGDAEMDAYHAEILSLVHSISCSQSLREPLLVLQSFAARCFSQEEARMLSCHYPQARHHLEDHSRFLHLIQALSDEKALPRSHDLLAELTSLIENHFERQDISLMNFLNINSPTDMCESECHSPSVATKPAPHPLHIELATYLVHDERIDVDHGQLIEIINALTSGRLPYGAALTALDEYAEYHFSMEEERMRDTAYPEFEAHAAAHNNFRLRLRWLLEKPDDTEMVPEMLHRYLGMWLINHILHVDRRLACFLKEHGPQQN